MGLKSILMVVPMATAGLVHRASGRINVGAGSTVNWLRLRAGGGGQVEIGTASTVHCRIDFDTPAGRVRVGNRCFIGASQLVCHTNITIGDDVIVSWGVTIVDHDSHSLDRKQRRLDVGNWRRGLKDWAGVAVAPVIVADGAWIGFGASILKGVRVGEGAIIGAQAVVTRDVAAYTVVTGNPARVVRTLGAGDPAS
jgi:acetyltransferase-like isoleucine patch superfamily enzyme